MLQRQVMRRLGHEPPAGVVQVEPVEETGFSHFLDVAFQVSTMQRVAA
jgi:hypothetical protein